MSENKEEEQSAGKRRGLKRGIKREKYGKSTERERARIIAAAENGENWETLAETFGIKKEQHTSGFAREQVH
jgi:hypothetical protein